MKKRSEKRVSRKGAKGAKVTGRGPSSRADARDLRKISPFGRNDKGSFFACLASLRHGSGHAWRDKFFVSRETVVNVIVTRACGGLTDARSVVERVRQPGKHLNRAFIARAFMRHAQE